jgi:hypothetical protein
LGPKTVLKANTPSTSSSFDVLNVAGTGPHPPPSRIS